MARPKDVEVRDARVWLRAVRKEVLRELRAQARRLRKTIRAGAPKSKDGGPDGRGGRLKPGNLRRKLKVSAGVDRIGPWARVTTTARNPRTKYRYGLAIQRRRRYMQDGMRRTPRQ